MTVPRVTLTSLTPDTGADLLVVGPSLGTAVVPLWSACVAALGSRFTVVGYDAPGHGASPATDEPFTVAELATAVAEAVRPLTTARGTRARYAGVSLGGAVGLELALAHADVVSAVAVICSGAKIGERSGWLERAELVRSAGTPVMVEGSATRWFAPGFIGREPTTATALLASLQDADRFSYARACEALAAFDVGDRLGDLRVPVLAAVGALDTVVPTFAAAQIEAAAPDGEAVVLDGAAHLGPAEVPVEMARLLTDFFTRKVLTRDAS